MLNAVISVIVPVYNAESSIVRCVRSIQAQTYEKWELLLVDDGSTDRSSEICDALALQDARIFVFHKKNGGVSSARNFAIDRVNTLYFVCVDSDDSVEPDYLSELLKAKKLYPQARHVWCGFQTTDFAYNVQSTVLADRHEKYSLFGCREVMTLYKLWLVQSPCNKLYETFIVNQGRIRMDESKSLGEDLLFNLEYMNIDVEAEIVVINLPLYNYTTIVEGQSLDHRYRSDLAEIMQKLSEGIAFYLNKWEVAQDQKQIFDNVRFYQMEKILRNTFHPDNKLSFLQKLGYNRGILKSDDFKKALKMRDCNLHPWVLIAYKKNSYLAVLVIERLSKIKHRLSRFSHDKDRWQIRRASLEDA